MSAATVADDVQSRRSDPKRSNPDDDVGKLEVPKKADPASGVEEAVPAWAHRWQQALHPYAVDSMDRAPGTLEDRD